jgi:hypothetical protein
MKNRKPLPFKAPLVLYQDGQKAPRLSETVKRFLEYLAQLFRASYVAIILILIAVFVGAYFPRVIAMPNINIDNIFKAIFKSVIPTSIIIIGCLITALAYAIFFFREKYVNNSKNQPDPFTRFLAVLYLTLCSDLYLLTISSTMLYRLDLNFAGYEYLLLAQFATIVMMVILVSVYRRFAQITIPSFTTQVIPTRSLKLYDLIRFIASVLVVILLVVFIANLNLTIKSQLPIDNLPELLAGRLTFTQLGAFIVSLMVASFAFKPSAYRSFPKSIGSIRLLVFVICGISIGLIYQQLDNTTTYIAVITSSFILTILGTPLQRSIS